MKTAIYEWYTISLNLQFEMFKMTNEDHCIL